MRLDNTLHDREREKDEGRQKDTFYVIISFLLFTKKNVIYLFKEFRNLIDYIHLYLLNVKFIKSIFFSFKFFE